MHLGIYPAMLNSRPIDSWIFGVGAVKGHKRYERYFLLSDFQFPNALSIHNRPQLDFTQAFVTIFSVKLPFQIFKLSPE